MTTSSLKTITRGLRLMTPRELKKSAAIVSLMMGAGFLESAIVALVIPIVYVTIDPSKLNSTKLGQYLNNLFSIDQPEQFFVYLASVLVTLLILSSFLSAYTRYVSELHGANCVKRLSGDLLKRCMTVPYAWVLEHDTTHIAQYVLNDVRMWRSDFVSPLFIMIQAGIMIIAPVLVTVSLAPISGLMALGTAAIIVTLVVLALRRKIYRVSYQQRENHYAVTKTVRQIVEGMREIKVSGQQDYYVRIFDRYHDIFNRSFASLRAWNEAPTTIIMLLGQIGFLATGVVLFLNKTSTAEIAAQLALIGFVVTRVLPAFNRLAIQVPCLTRSAPYVQSLLRLFDEFDRIAPSESIDIRKPVPGDWHQLRLDRVSFKYASAENWSLQDAEIELERGGFYGFVGRSGGGKSTLANLLLGLIEPTRGAVTLDGKPLNEFSLADWQKRFGYVPQDPFILDDTVRENITFGVVAGTSQIETAVDLAQLTDVVGNLPKGLDERVGERGRQLSGGQVQRLAIARALFRSPDVYFFDEATSALDGITETALMSSLRESCHDKLIIMITHRLNSLRDCDKIFVLDHGRIVATGTYDELTRNSQQFRDLAALDADRLLIDA